MTLWLVRHARPLVEEGVCYGASDVPVDAASTSDCAARLACELPQRFRLLSSPLQRCARLAQEIAALRPGVTIEHDERLREMDFGCWEGVRWDVIPRVAFDAWMADFATHAFGGRETVQSLMQRVAALRAEAAREDGDMVWVTHAGVLRAMSLLAQGVAQVEHGGQWPRETLHFGQWLRFAI
ncbi:MAG: histidine phosphatase family protein [Gammaproteobacteria bacterium]|nr:histidine phosphatase family protein [Gammaproteobacteria bacterium]